RDWSSDVCSSDLGGQGHDLGQRDVLVKAYPALARPARRVVLHAVPFKVRDAAVVQLDRHIDAQGALGALQGFHPTRQRPQVRRNAVDFLKAEPPRAYVCGIRLGRRAMGGVIGREQSLQAGPDSIVASKTSARPMK